MKRTSMKKIREIIRLAVKTDLISGNTAKNGTIFSITFKL